MQADATPMRWTHDPSALRARLPVIGLAICGLGLATYLTLYQLGFFDQVWDPFFGSAQSALVLHSFMSRLLPIPDAALGAASYATEIILGLVGGKARWRRMPWIVTLYGLNVLGAAIASLVLAILQPTVIHAWCLLCLGSGLISLLILALALPEIRATWLYLRGEPKGGRSLWRAFWGLSPQPVAHKDGDWGASSRSR